MASHAPLPTQGVLVRRVKATTVEIPLAATLQCRPDHQCLTRSEARVSRARWSGKKEPGTALQTENLEGQTPLNPELRAEAIRVRRHPHRFATSFKHKNKDIVFFCCFCFSPSALEQRGAELNVNNPSAVSTERRDKLRARLGYWKSIGCDDKILSWIAYRDPCMEKLSHFMIRRGPEFSIPKPEIGTGPRGFRRKKNAKRHCTTAARCAWITVLRVSSTRSL